MAEGDIAGGWYEAPAGEWWRCPECGQSSPVAEWREVEPYCDDCGSHDGRECPRCGQWFDHVWGAATIAAGQPVPTDEEK